MHVNPACWLSVLVCCLGLAEASAPPPRHQQRHRALAAAQRANGAIVKRGEGNGTTAIELGSVLSARAPARKRQKPARQSKAKKSAKRRGKAKTVKNADKRPPSPAAASAPPSSASPQSPATSPKGGLPANVKKLYDSTANGTKCPYTLDTSRGFNTNGDGGNYAHYCGDKPSKPSVVYWRSNMDVDCDGASRSGACANDDAHQSMTSYQYNGKYIDAQKVPYVVINQERDFDPVRVGVQPLATVGVVCGGKLVWAIFGDTNEKGNMGEGSVALAQACFGSTMSGDNGHDPADVLYFAFAGDDAVDPHGGTDLGSLAKLGQSLLARLD